jgi:hypothetical protein
MKIPSEVIDIDRAVRALRYYRPRASGRMPAVLDSVYHAVVGLREAIRAKWEPEMQEYWVRDLAKSLEHWRLAREEVEHDE